MNAVELNNAVLTALGKISDKCAERDELTDGASYDITGTVAGTIDGHAFSMPIDCTLTVGHESVKSSSVTPKQVNIVGKMFSKMNAATRAAIAASMLEEYAETGDIACDDHMLEMAEIFLAGMRQAKQVTQRGAVRVNTPTKDCGIVLEAVA